MVIQFVLESIRNIPQVYREQKIFFFITLIILLISTVYHFRYAVSLSSRISQPVLKVIVFAGELLGSLALMLSGAVFISASEIAKLNPEMLNHRFFLELILCAILYCLYSALLIYLYQKKEEKLTAAGQWTKDDEEENIDKSNEQVLSFLSGVAVIILSLIGFFTGTGIYGAGPVLFGKKLGEWLFSFYSGWAINIMLTLVFGAIQYALAFLVGNRTQAFMNDAESAIDQSVDKGFDLYDKLYGDKSDKEKKAIRMRLLAIAAALLAVILLVTVVRRITAGSSDGTTAKEAGNGTVLTGDESIEELTQMAENGNAEAQRELGFILANPEDGTEPDYEEAFRWSMAAAEQGNEYACYDVGLAYQLGNGVEKNYEEAEKWYIKAADAGLTFAYHVIGYLYLYPEEPNEPDSATAASWFARGAEEGDQTSAYELGLLYEEGNGVEQDYEKAAEFYLQAAEGEYGYKYVQYHLGVLYEYGLGVTEDRDEALYWYKAAADQGHTTAQEEYDRLMQTDNP